MRQMDAVRAQLGDRLPGRVVRGGATQDDPHRVGDVSPSRRKQGADLVIVANRLPVDRVVDDQGNVTWRRSPGGLVSALEPVMQANDGAWIGWPGGTDEDLEPFEEDGIQLVPIAMSQAEIEEFYEGFSNATLWPLYHDVVAKPAFHREWWDAYVRVNQRFAERGGRGGREGRHRVGAGLPAPAGARRCCATCGPTSGSGSTCTSRSRPRSCSSSCRGAGRSSRDSSAPTWSASSSPGGAQNFVRLVRQRVGHKTHRDQMFLPDGRVVTAQVVPDLDRHGRVRGAGPLRGGAEAVRRDPAAARQPAQGVPRHRPARLHQGHLRPAPRLRRADRATAT